MIDGAERTGDDCDSRHRATETVCRCTTPIALEATNHTTLCLLTGGSRYAFRRYVDRVFSSEESDTKFKAQFVKAMICADRWLLERRRQGSKRDKLGLAQVDPIGLSPPMVSGVPLIFIDQLIRLRRLLTAGPSTSV
jgi:hypothetical protein